MSCRWNYDVVGNTNQAGNAVGKLMNLLLLLFLKRWLLLLDKAISLIWADVIKFRIMRETLEVWVLFWFDLSSDCKYNCHKKCSEGVARDCPGSSMTTSGQPYFLGQESDGELRDPSGLDSSLDWSQTTNYNWYLSVPIPPYRRFLLRWQHRVAPNELGTVWHGPNVGYGSQPSAGRTSGWSIADFIPHICYSSISSRLNAPSEARITVVIVRHPCRAELWAPDAQRLLAHRECDYRLIYCPHNLFLPDTTWFSWLTFRWIQAPFPRRVAFVCRLYSYAAKEAVSLVHHSHASILSSSHSLNSFCDYQLSCSVDRAPYCISSDNFIYSRFLHEVRWYAEMLGRRSIELRTLSYRNPLSYSNPPITVSGEESSESTSRASSTHRKASSTPSAPLQSERGTTKYEGGERSPEDEDGTTESQVW